VLTLARVVDAAEIDPALFALWLGPAGLAVEIYGREQRPSVR
jgi:hypothetical protein